MSSTIDPVKQTEIVTIVSVGGSLRTAAKHVGSTLAAVRQEVEGNPEFAERLKRAESHFEVIHLSNIQQAGKKSWNASAWLLERVFPERFGKRRPRTIAVEQLKEVLDELAKTITDEVSDPDRRDRLLACLTKILSKLNEDAKPAARSRKKPK
ncbi:MAG TPA: hypothetical protein VHD36_08450 [Pirellulales bacterium]|nr:hypothetical protein [Pirellulales bacterium]